MDKKLDISEIKRLLSKLNHEVNDEYLKYIFKEFDKDQNNAIDFYEFIQMMDSMRQREELRDIYNQYVNKKLQIIDNQ